MLGIRTSGTILYYPVRNNKTNLLHYNATMLEEVTTADAKQRNRIVFAHNKETNMGVTQWTL